MSKEQARLLRFLLKYPNGWHSYAPSVRRTLETLEAWGLVIISRETKQMRLRLGSDEQIKAYANGHDVYGNA